MIPSAIVTAWRARAPWTSDAQVEQDLVLSRALVDIFATGPASEALALRGGTALYKLYAPELVRYSEDIDLIQSRPEPIGATLTAIRGALDPWLGEPKRDFNEGRVILRYRFVSSGTPALPARLKVEINSREHFTVYGLERRPFEVATAWFTGQAAIPTFALDELMATKLRALYQRKKGRDLFDLWYALERHGAEPGRIVEAYGRYLEYDQRRISAAEFLANLEAKLRQTSFMNDVPPLLARGISYDPAQAFALLVAKVLPLLPGGAELEDLVSDGT